MLKIREQLDVLKRSGWDLRESFVESLKGTGGQSEHDLAISQETLLAEPEMEGGSKSRKKYFRLRQKSSGD